MQDSEIRVLIVTAAFYIHDGVTMTIRRIIQYLEEQGGKALVVTTCPESGYDAMEGYDTVVVRGTIVPLQNTGFEYMLGVEIDKEAERQILEFAPNIAHFTVPDLVGLDGVRLCQQHGIPYMCTWHSNYVDYMKYYRCIHWWLGPLMTRYFWAFYAHMPVVYVPTEFIREKCRQEGFARVTDLRVWGRGVDTQLFSPDQDVAAFRKRYHIPENVVLVLWVGRIVQEKRPDIWVECLRRLGQEGIDYYGLVVGKGSHEALMNSIPNTVTIGWLEGPDLAAAYAAADLLLFPSAVETFGNVTLEALACGTPAVVDAGCSGHLVQSGRNGFACASDDADAYYAAVRRCVTDPALRLELRRNARPSALRWDRRQVLQEMLDHYREVAAAFDTLPHRRVAGRCCGLKQLGRAGECLLELVGGCFKGAGRVVGCCRAVMVKCAGVARRGRGEPVDGGGCGMSSTLGREDLL